MLATNGGLMTYDANGNMSASGFNGPETFNYDVENRLVHNRQLDGFGLQDDYVYDGAGNLVRRRITSTAYPGVVDQKYTYADGLYEEQTNACDPSGATTKFYLAFGRIIARRDTNGGLTYLLADHLGSNVGSIKATTGATTTNKYYPFGAPRLNTSAYGDKAYTGQQKEIVSYLDAYYYHARFYSPDLGHFLSADPIAKDGLNRYAYVRNNPLRYTDPSGLYLMLECGWGQNCDNGNAGQNSIDQWRTLTIQYWLSGNAKVNFGSDPSHLSFVFNLFAGALSRRDAFSAADIVNTFDAFSLDSSHNGMETDARRSAGNLATAAGWIKAATGQDITYLAGFSWGAVTSYEYLWGLSEGKYYGTRPRGVYLVGGPNVFDLPFPINSAGGVFQSDAPGDFDIGAAFNDTQVVARSARIELLDHDIGIPGLTVNIAGLVDEISGGADLRPPLPDSCGHCVESLASSIDSATVFR